MRKSIIAANWKMYFTVEEAKNYISEIKDLIKDTSCEVVIFPPHVSISTVKEEAQGTNILIGAQNMHFEDQGAFTGEISPIMLKSLGVEYVIIGHSERRTYFNEDNDMINKKLKTAFKYGIKPILCVGECLKDREAGTTFPYIERQLKLALVGLKKSEIENLAIAYEPIWAIGTGRTATADVANETIGYIRSVIKDLYGYEIAANIRILYGGSVKPGTIKEQMEKEHIDGALVGGASLIVEDFAKIVNY